MTTIIIIGEALTIPRAYDAHDALADYHVRAVQARFANQLEELIVNPPQRKYYLSDLADYPEYEGEVKRLDNAHSLWAIRDHRMLFFAPEFAKLARDVRLVWNDTGKPGKGYSEALNKLCKGVYDKFTGPKLRLIKEDGEALRVFVNEPLKVDDKAVKVEEKAGKK